LTSSCQTEIALASFLGQSVIPVGHHEDVASGLDLLRQLADLLNSIGKVQWSDLGSIARSNFSSQRESHRLYVKMYSRLIQLIVPGDIEEVCVERPWLGPQDTEPLSWREGQLPPQTLPEYQGEPIQTRPGTQLEIGSAPPNAFDATSIPQRRTPLWVVGRRQVCEVRDRLRPLLSRVRPVNRRDNGS
jgi:hypothetical protein